MKENLEICLWYNSVLYGTTGLDVKEGHPLYKCRICKDPNNKLGSCKDYHSLKFKYKNDKENKKSY